MDRPPRVRVHASKEQAIGLLQSLDRVHASKEQAIGLLQSLDRGGRLRPAPKEKIRSSHLCGCFALVKDSEKDRMILDARPPNELETPLQTWCETLGSLQSLSQLELEAGFNMYSCTSVALIFEITITVFEPANLRSLRNCFNLPLTVDQARKLDCFEEHLRTHQTIYACPNTHAMGAIKQLNWAKKHMFVSEWWQELLVLLNSYPYTVARPGEP